MRPSQATEPYEIVPADPAHWSAIADLLTASGLPLDGLEPHLGSAIVAREAGGIVGCAALELYGHDALLRSVAVAPARRGGGVGLALTAACLELARRHGVRTLWLLTETAGEFFPRFGFERMTREAVPASVRQSVEFTSACPESAAVMRLRLRSAAEG
jgi:amino-acid N-acetyltransferase